MVLLMSTPVLNGISCKTKLSLEVTLMAVDGISWKDGLRFKQTRKKRDDA